MKRMTIKQHIISYIQRVTHDLELDGNPLVVDPQLIKVDYPTEAKHGDYATNLALIIAKKLSKNPLEVAEYLADKLRSVEQEVIEKIDVVQPGFINFWIKNETLQKNVTPEFPDVGHGRSVVVEYSSPNIAKPFTVGHLRSTIIGDAIANLLQAIGWNVHRDNHVGDWGTQFGKQIYAMKEWGNEEEIEQSERPVKLLVDLYVKFHDEAEKDPSLEDKAREWFKKLEDGDEEARKLWQKCIEWSWKEFEVIYQQLGVTFTENNGRGYGEAFFEDKMDSVIKELEEKDLLQTGENGAKLVFFPNEEFTPLMILKKDGATLYSTRDLATDKFRLEKYGKNVTIINEVGAEQALYFRQLYKLEEMLGWYEKDQRVHKKHGLYRFKEGKMSTRKGNVIWLEDVLEEARKKAEGLGELEGEEGLENAGAVGIGALKWNDLKRSSEQDIVFDWDEILNMQGNSGPYIQYTFARTQSVLRKSQSADVKSQILEGLKIETEERELLRLVARFPEIVQEAAERLSPNMLCTYLFDLAQNFNLFYQKCPILKAEGESREFRLHLTQATGEVLKKGLSLLGIQAPSKM